MGGYVSDTTLPSPRQVETPRVQEQEGAPEPPQSGGAGGPITISDGSGGDHLSKDARAVDEEVEASPIAKRMPWPIRLHSIEERRKKEEERKGGEEEEEEERRRQQGERLEELLEQNWLCKSCWSFRGSNSNGVSSWKSCSNSLHEARASQYYRRRKGLRLERRDCRFMVRRPLRGVDGP